MPRPSTPNMANSSRPVDPSSPPQTPKSACAGFNSNANPNSNSNPEDIQQQEKKSQNSNGQVASSKTASRQTSRRHRRFGIHPVGNGFNFSYRPMPNSSRPDQLSPRSSSSSSAEESDSNSSTSDSPPRSLSSEQSINEAKNPRAHIWNQHHNHAQPNGTSQPKPLSRIVVEATFIIEELTDFDDGSDDDRRNVIRPDLIEYADSDRSRSRSRNPPPSQELDRRIVSDFRDLNPYDTLSEGSDIDEAEYEKTMREQREEKRRKRMSFGSMSKRTVSERGSDSDREDLMHSFSLDANDTRRIRRRVGDRRSLIVDPPRIDELEEPDSSEEILDDAGLLAREFPYYDYIIMEMDSS